MSSVYDLVDNNTQSPVDLSFEVGRDLTDFIAVSVRDDDRHYLVEVIIEPDRADDFFAAIDEVRQQWKQRQGND